MLRIKSEFVNDDWERIYINGMMVDESHSHTARQLMELLFLYGGEVQIERTQVFEEED